MQELPLKNDYFLVPTDPLARDWIHDVLPPTREEVMAFWREKLFRLAALTDMFTGKSFSIFHKGMYVPKSREEKLEWIEDRITIKAIGYSPGLFPCFFCTCSFHEESCHLVKLAKVDPDGRNSSNNIWNYFPACSSSCHGKRDSIVRFLFRTLRQPFEKELYLEYQDGYCRMETYLMEKIVDNFVPLIKHARRRYEEIHRAIGMRPEVREYEPLL